MSLLIGNQALQLRAGVFEQQREAFIESAFAILGRCDAVETHQRMQAEARQGFAPGRFAVVGAADKIQHRQQRFATTGQHFQFIAVLGQHRLAGIDHIEAGVAGQQLPQHLGFLFETLSCFAALEEACQPGRAVEAFAGALQAFEVIEQGDGVFQAGGVVEVEQGLAVDRQARAFDVSRGAGAMGHFTKADVTGQGAQQ